MWLDFLPDSSEAEALIEIVNLHTAARRYCIERYEEWASKYSQQRAGRQLGGTYSYTDRDRALFPRYLVLDAIRVELERSVPGGFESTGTAMSLLLKLAEFAESEATRNLNGAIEREVMDEERSKLRSHLEGLERHGFPWVRPLPFRRTLSEPEAEQCRIFLLKVWGATSPWHPDWSDPRLANCWSKIREPLERGSDPIRQLLRAQGVTRLFDLHEEAPHCEMDLDFWCPTDNAGSFGFDRSLSWLVYADQSGCLTVVGRLAEALERKEL